MNSKHLAHLSVTRALLAVLLLAAAGAGSGCAMLGGSSTGAGTVAYVSRELQASLPVDYSKVVAAARVSIKELEFASVSDNKDALKAVLVARTALDKKVEITITNAGRKSTNVVIQVGFLGDKDLSFAILEKIKSKL